MSRDLSASGIRSRFFAEAGAVLLPPEPIFDDLYDVVFFLKDMEGRYVLVNQTLADRRAGGSKDALIGKRPRDVFPEDLAEFYERQDAQVLRSGRPVSRQLELHIYPGGSTGWCLTSKHPIHSSAGRIIGIAGISRDLHGPGENSSGFRELATALDQMQRRFSETLRIEELARVAGLSVYQFEQRVRRLFQMTPLQLLHKLRIEEATRQLRTTDLPLVEIALAVGYCDQSAFTRQFSKLTGVTPGRFRAMATGEA
ncbi:MAG: AraC family transcriptional regulator [Verrucomicrobiaceae bacterium]|nr:MAG: AraC family transcriptional regulator [Verrucomicrobiaceae bacterium]